MTDWTKGGRPRLKNYVFFKEVADRILFDAGQKSFVIQGANVYPLVAKVIQLMDAGHGREEIARAIPDKVRPVFERLFDALSSHEMLIDGDIERGILADHPGSPPFLEFLRYLEDNVGDYRSAFERWRRMTVALMGNGFSLKAAVNCFATSGVGFIDVFLDSSAESRPGTEEIERILAAQAERDAAFAYRMSTIDAAANAVSGDASLVLYVSDNLGRFDRQHSLGRIASTLASPSMVAGVSNGRGVVSPVREEGYADFRDLEESLTPVAADSPEGLHSPASCAVIGSVAAFNAIKHHFEIDRPGLRNYVFVVSPFLDVGRHPLLPAPAVSHAGDLRQMAFLSKTELPQDRVLSRYEQIRIDLQPLFDPITGYFSGEEAKDLKQLPLYHDAIAVRFPRSLNRQPELVVGWGVDAEDAGLRTIVRAMSVFASATADEPGAAIVADFEYASWVERATAAAVVTWAAFSRLAHSAKVRLDDVDDRSVQLLLRLLELYSSADVYAHLYWIPGANAYWAECVAAGEKISAAVGPSATRAIIEALGAACSARQFPERATWRDPAPPSRLKPPQRSAALSELSSAAGDSEDAAPFVMEPRPQRFGLALMAGIYSGQVELLIGEVVAQG